MLAGRISHTIRALDYKNVCLEEIFKYIDIINSLGIKNINFNIKLLEQIGSLDNWLDYAKSLKDYTDSLSMKFVVTHAPYENSLVLSNGFNQELIKKTLKAIEVTKLLEVSTMVVHSGISYVDGVYSEELTENQNFDYWKDVCIYAKKFNINIAFENDVVADYTDKKHIFKPSVTTVCNFVRKFDFLDNVKICYDIGHAFISWNEIIDNLYLVKDYLGCFHIHNNLGLVNTENYWKNDTHNPCYDGIIDIRNFFDNLKNISYKGDIVIESVYRDSLIESLKLSIDKDYKFISGLL